MSRELIIEPNSLERQYWRDLWNYRELFIMLAWRDVAVRYKQTLIGVLWAIIRPLLTMLAFTFVFGKVAKLSTEGDAPYSLLVFAAMLPWQLFSTALVGASESLLGNANLISKVYFPRMLVPASTIAVSIVDFAISVILLLPLLIFYKIAPSLQILAIFPLTLLASALALGPGLLFCAINVKYRDFRYALPFITQFGLYISPVGFSSKIVAEKWRIWFELNPMVGVIDGFRWAILGTSDFPYRSLSFSVTAAILFFVIGIKQFRSTEKTLVDII